MIVNFWYANFQVDTMMRMWLLPANAFIEERGQNEIIAMKLWSQCWFYQVWELISKHSQLIEALIIICPIVVIHLIKFGCSNRLKVLDHANAISFSRVRWLIRLLQLMARSNIHSNWRSSVLIEPEKYLCFLIIILELQNHLGSAYSLRR